MSFGLSSAPLEVDFLRQGMISQNCGGYVAFEGWVRDYNDGKAVLRLEYEAYAELAILEGHRIINEALDQFPVKDVRSIHRVGLLGLKEVAVWVGVSAIHRGEAWLEKLHISAYEPATRANPTDPQRRRKLLLHRREIDRLDGRIAEKGLTLVPLTVYFLGGRAKIELALARGKHRHDKRETIRRREQDRETQRAMRRHRR